MCPSARIVVVEVHWIVIRFALDVYSCFGIGIRLANAENAVCDASQLPPSSLLESNSVCMFAFCLFAVLYTRRTPSDNIPASSNITEISFEHDASGEVALKMISL